MTVRAAFWKWAVLGAIAAGFLLATQAAAVGGLGGLLQVGANSALRPVIERELGPIPLAPGPGHDGQIYYAIGVDLGGAAVPELLDHGAFRYRRVLYPALASVFGLLGGEPLLWGMIVLSALSMSVAAGTVAALSRSLGRPEWLALSVILNPGVWLSVRLLTADVLALALMVLGLALMDRHRGWSVTSFVGSVLAKDVYLATPVGLLVGGDRRRWRLAVIPLLALVAWMGWLTVVMGDGFTGRGNLAFPFMGIVEGAQNWAGLGVEELVYLAFALVSVFGGLLFAALRPGRLRWAILAWSLLGVISSDWVWDLGNNAARVFAPIVVLVALAFAQTATGARSGEAAALAGS